MKLLEAKVDSADVLVCKYEQKLTPEGEEGKKILHDLKAENLYAVLTYGPSFGEKPNFLISEKEVRLLLISLFFGILTVRTLRNVRLNQLSLSYFLNFFVKNSSLSFVIFSLCFVSLKRVK